MKVQTFKIDKFGGLTTGPAEGTSPLRFRQCENLDPGKVPGALVVAYSRRLLLSGQNVWRAYTLGDLDPNATAPALVLEPATGATYTFFADWSVNTSSTLSPAYGASVNYRMLRFWRDKLVIVGMTRTSDGIPYPNFATPSGWVTADPVTTVGNNLGATTQTGAGGTIPDGSYTLQAVALRKLQVGNDTWYVADIVPQLLTVAGGLNIAGGPGKINFTFTPANRIDAIQLILTPTGGGVSYDAGVYTGNGTLLAIPTTTTVIPSTGYPYDWESGLVAQAIAYRQERTWAAFEPNYNYTLLNTVAGYGATQVKPSNGNLVWYSEVGRPWAFAPDNTIVADVDGQVTGLGVLGEALIIFGPYGAARLTGDGPDNFFVQRLEQVSPGTWWHESIQAYGGGLLWLGPDGVYRLTGDGQVQRISDAIKDVFDGLKYDRSTQIRTTVDRRRGLYIIASPVNATFGQAVYACDLRTGEWFKLPGEGGIPFGDLTVGIADATAAFDTSTADLYALDGTALATAYLATDQLDLGVPDQTKQFLEVRVPVENYTSSDATVTLTWEKRNGTGGSLSTRTIVAGTTAELRWKLPGHLLVDRSVSFGLTINAKPGFVVMPPLEVTWAPRANQ